MFVVVEILVFLGLNFLNICINFLFYLFCEMSNLFYFNIKFKVFENVLLCVDFSIFLLI